MIVINFKNYKSGSSAIRLAGNIWKILPDAIVAAGAADIRQISSIYPKEKIFAQHVDFVEGKLSTGFLSAETLKSHGGKGSLLNHSEHRLTIELIRKTVKQMKKEKLKIILCAKDLEEAKSFISLAPDAIAFEDKKLIGSGKSITKYKSKAVEKFASTLKGTKIIPLCGAGISTAEDILAAYELGCKGVLIASAIASAPKQKVKKLLKEISALKGKFF